MFLLILRRGDLFSGEINRDSVLTPFKVQETGVYDNNEDTVCLQILIFEACVYTIRHILVGL